MSTSKIIVTGGAGFIGSNLVDALIELGHDVHVIDNLSAGKKEQVNAKAHLHVLDIVDFKAIRPLFEGVDTVFHLAALPRVQFSIDNPLETHQANVTGTLNILVAAQQAKVNRVINTASSAAYGDQPIMPLKESFAAMPKSPYGLHKHIGELYCRVWNTVYGIETVSLRYFNVYGPRNSSEGAYALVIPKFIQQRLEGKALTITGDGLQTRDFTHVRDIVRANILAMQSTKVGAGEVLNIGAGRNQSVNRVAELIGGPVEYIPARFEPKNILADNSLAKELIGWKPEVLFEDGVKELKDMAGLS